MTNIVMRTHMCIVMLTIEFNCVVPTPNVLAASRDADRRKNVGCCYALEV